MVDRPLASPGPAAVERIESGEGFLRLREGWADLLADSPADAPFLTWEWLYSWWGHFSAGRRLFILVVRHGHEIIAIAPWAAHRRGLTRVLALPTLHFLGSGSVGSDYLDLIVRRGHEETAVRAIGEHLQRAGFALELGQVLEDRGVAQDLAGQLRLHGWGLFQRRVDVCPFVRVAGLSFDSYLDTLGASHRYNFRRRLRNLTRRFDVRLQRAITLKDRREALELLVAMHNVRWRERGGSNALHTPALVAFHREVVGRAAERGWLRLHVLRLDGRPAAALYGFLYGRTFYFYQAGFDVKRRKDSVGLVTLGLVIRSAMEEGAEEVDLLHGSEDYKFLWAREVRRLVRLELYPPHARGRLSRGAAELRWNARCLARRLLPRGAPARLSPGGGRAE
jgi:CelD/BcsL family acetyltransferase involved in cellulose biosynthesis